MNNENFFNSPKYLIPDTLQNICLNPLKSKNSFLYDDFSNSKILDFHGFFSTLPLGYNHKIFNNPKFKKTVMMYAGLKPSAGRIMTKFLDEFISEFHNFVNSKIFHKYFFIHGGGLAVENAIKIAIDWKNFHNKKNKINIDPKKLEIISFKNGFHGVTGYTLNLSDNDVKVSGLPIIKWPKFEASVHNYENDSCSNVEKNLGIIEKYLDRKDKKNKIAAIIIETIQGGGGDRHICKDFLNGLARILKKNKILFIDDEVQTGFGVTGKLWSFQKKYYNFTPDLLAFGKKSQISGVCINKNLEDIDSVINRPGRYPPTWNGDIIDYVRCRYIIKAYKDDKLIKNAENLGKYIVNSLSSLKKFKNVRGKGFLIAFDFENTKIRDNFYNEAFRKKLMVQPMQDKTIRIRPNMALKLKEADMALNIIDSIKI